MANYASITFTLTSTPTLSSGGIGCKLLRGEGTATTQYMMTVYPANANGSGNFDVSSGNLDTITDNIAFAFNLSYTDMPGGPTLYELPIDVTYDTVAHTITITANVYDNIVFKLTSTEYIAYNLGTYFSFVIIDEVEPEIFRITTSYFTNAPANECTEATFVVNTLYGVYPITITSPTLIPGITQDSLEVVVDRQRLSGASTFTAEDDDGNIITITIPQAYQNVLTGVDITRVGILYNVLVLFDQIGVSGSEPLSPAVSLDGFNWYFSPSYGYVFNNLSPGDYTAYLRDNGGCEQTYPFTITEIGDKPDPIFDISRVNAIRFVDNLLEEVFDALWRKQRFTNLYYQEFFHSYESLDSVTIQIRTNYDTITATLRNCYDEEIRTYNVQKLITNIGLTYPEIGTTQCYVKQGNDNDAYIFFPNYKIGLPEVWMGAGNKITVDIGTASVTYEVTEVLYDPEINKDVLVIPYTYVGGILDTICQIEYNLEDWNIHEFAATFDGIDTGEKYYIEVIATDTDVRYTDVTWISEMIYVLSEHDDSVLIEYQDTDSSVIGDIIPSTGIIHRLRVQARLKDYGANRESEVFLDDRNNVSKQKQVNSRTLTLEVFSAPFIDEKIGYAISHETFLVDGISFQAIDPPETESKIEERNPFVLTRLILQQNNSIIKTDLAGIVSSSRTIIGTSQASVVIGGEE